MEVIHATNDGIGHFADDIVEVGTNIEKTLKHLFRGSTHEVGVWLVKLDSRPHGVVLFWIYMLKFLGFAYDYDMRKNQISICPTGMTKKELTMLLRLIFYIETERDTILKRWLRLNYGLKEKMDPMQILCLAHYGKTNGTAVCLSGGVVTVPHFWKRMKNRTHLKNMFGKTKVNQSSLFEAVRTANFNRILNLCQN